MDVAYTNKQLVTIEFPGTVLNLDKFVKTLGGEKEIFSVFRNSSKRLELKLRPDDPYCKSAHGDCFNTTNLILKVVKRTKKQINVHSAQNTSLDSKNNADYKLEFLGVACSSYKFKALSDFQIPPITYDETNKEHRSLIPDLVPTSLHPTSWLQKKVELFIPPLIFSRFDLPQNGYVDIHTKTPKKIARILPPNTIGQSRLRRAGYAVFTTFESTVSTDLPKSEAVLQLKNYPLEYDIKKKLDILFDERPIWTRTALLDKMKVEKSRIKHALPCVAYYFTNGPWRALWVKFGFNPRKNPAAKIYQIMDLRINPNIPVNDQRNKRRQMYYTLPNKSVQNQHRVATINTDSLVRTTTDEVTEEDNEKVKLLLYNYFPGELPTYRQCFYQLCDIHLDSVQQLIHQNDGKEEYCHEKDGWCIPGTLDKCRELILADIIKTSKITKENEN